MPFDMVCDSPAEVVWEKPLLAQCCSWHAEAILGSA